MKLLFILALTCSGLLLGGCADNSLLTEEEYRSVKGPAPYSPDPTMHMPHSPHTNRRY